ncbi:MAG: TetR/AcrR family transcriptional regulator [Alphaproteobacteria bacterium]|nr:TetR/AcrR family transcriptional regulator [Alphaproteobacteria bacterium]
MTAKKRRFTKQDWLEFGLKTISEHGSEAVKLANICNLAGLTRGSFYHHFSTHDLFLTEVAELWLTWQTGDIISEVSQLSIDTKSDTENREERLTNLALQIDYSLELGIRELSRKSEAVRQVVRRADHSRVEFLKELYIEKYNLDEATARKHAVLEYAAFNGAILLHENINREEQRELSDLFSQMTCNFLKMS